MELSVLGCGPWGQNIIRTVHELAEDYPVQLGAVVHRGNTERAAAVGEMTGVKCTTDVEPVLYQSDAVLVATPDDTHPGYVRRALQADNHVFVEKPIAHEAVEAADLFSLAADRDRVLMVGHLMTYHPAIRHLNELLTDESPSGVECFVHRFNNLRRDSGRRLLYSSFIHDCSIVEQLFSGMPDEVILHDRSGPSNRLNFVDGRLEWAGEGVVRFQCGSEWPARRRTFSVRTADRFYDFDGIDETLTVYDEPDRRHANGVVHEYDRLPLTLELKDFLESILEQRPPAIGQSHVMNVMDMLDRLDREVTKTTGSS